jgi:hypothetical protein
VSIPEGDAIDFSKAKMGKVAFKNQTKDDLKKIEAIRAGVQHLRKLKEQMEKERYDEEMKLNARMIKDKREIKKIKLAAMTQVNIPVQESRNNA